MVTMKNNTIHSLATYVSDMMALEKLVCGAFGVQQGDKDFDLCGAGVVVQRLRAISEQHYTDLEVQLERLGGHPAAGAKAAVAETSGLVAAGAARLKKTKVAKGLRDDYAAVALCIVSYGELLVTANAFADDLIADLAEKHMHEYTKLCRGINEVMPAVVLNELQGLDLDVDMRSVDRSRQTIVNVWRGIQPEHRTTHGTVEPNLERIR
jgi:hypothetical protein